MFLPELSFALAVLDHEQLYLGPNRELNNVVTQFNPVYLILVLPGATEPQVHICFPAPGVTRVYNRRIHQDSMIKEDSEEYLPKAPTEINYRYGMQLKPWMFFCWLDAETKEQRSKRNNIVNYIVLNCMSGHSGVVISVFRTHDASDKHMEWMEIHHFEMGNDLDFFQRWQVHPHTRLLARFTPRGVGTPELTWQQG